jgi:ppGpp synthetase/RelA/SpoT-type nucleotidyltranferase
MRRALTAVETEVAYLLLGLTLELHPYERILIRGRVKDSESAIASLRRRQEGGAFDRRQTEKYSLLSLPDLVAIRVLAFPPQRLGEADRIIRARILGWTSDPIRNDANGEPIALKYHGYWNDGDRVRTEIQIVPLLIGLFWEVEHAAIYKPDPSLSRIMRTPAMNARTGDVIDALLRFEQEFEREIQTRFELLDEE